MKRAILALMLCAGAADASEGTDRLIAAARDGLDGDVARLIAAHVSVDAADDTGASALSWAVERDNKVVVARLLKARANPNLPDVNGVTPLMLAIDNNEPQTVKLLLAAGADPAHARPTGETPLMNAVRVGSADIVGQLLARKVDVNARDVKYHQTALMWAVGHPDLVRLLLDHGADVKAATRDWTTISTNYSVVVTILGNSGIPWLVDNEYSAPAGGVTALIFAAQKGNAQSVKMLLDAGADVNQASADGTTPLLAALYKFSPNSEMQDRNQRGTFGGLSFNPDYAMANLLLDRGAQARASDRAGYTPLHGAVLSMLKFRGGSITIGFNGNKPNTPNAPPPAPPQNEEAGLVLVNRLLEKGADPNAATRDATPGPLGAVKINPAPPGSTPYHLAAVSNSARLVEALASHGADANKLRKDGHTPFSVAVMSNSLPVVEVMAAHGANLAMIYNPSDKIPDPVKSLAEPRRNETILHIAAISGANYVVPFLGAHAVPLAAKNDHGETALDLADGQERYRLARAVEALGNNDKKGDGLVRETQSSDAIKALMGIKVKPVPPSALERKSPGTDKKAAGRST